MQNVDPVWKELKEALKNDQEKGTQETISLLQKQGEIDRENHQEEENLIEAVKEYDQAQETLLVQQNNFLVLGSHIEQKLKQQNALLDINKYHNLYIQTLRKQLEKTKMSTIQVDRVDVENIAVKVEKEKNKLLSNIDAVKAKESEIHQAHVAACRRRNSQSVKKQSLLFSASKLRQNISESESRVLQLENSLSTLSRDAQRMKKDSICVENKLFELAKELQSLQPLLTEATQLHSQLLKQIDCETTLLCQNHLELMQQQSTCKQAKLSTKALKCVLDKQIEEYSRTKQRLQENNLLLKQCRSCGASL